MDQLTPEQRARMEENRQRALERKRKFEESQRSLSVGGTHASNEPPRKHLSTLNSKPAVKSPQAEKPVYPIFRSYSAQSTPPTAVKSAPVHPPAMSSSCEAMDSTMARAQQSPKSAQASTAQSTPALGDAKLSDEQADVLEQIMAGKNVFITGCGGTGKSHLMHHAIKKMRELRGKMSVAVTATTGIAACHIGGTSLHTFAGIGLGVGSVDDLVKKVRSNRSSAARWQRTQALVVDEISMLDAELFDKLEALARKIKQTDHPFGGIQVILVGDFLQLPPVAKNGQHVNFCFDATSWKRVVQLHVELKHVFRQSNMDFVKLLNSVRWGQCSAEIEQALMATTTNSLNEAGGIQATRLYAKNAQVDEINAHSLKQLPGKAMTKLAQDTGEQPFLDQLKRNCLAPEELHLKPQAQVMLLKNIDPDRNLINGSRGVVKCFQRNDDPEIGEIGDWPVVEFETVKGRQELVVYPEEFTIEGQGKVLAKRSQVPLRLAYAITIHKCQGMTLNKVEMSLKDVFEPGQAYVALSRVSSLEGLRLLDFSPRAVRAHARVVQFYRQMNSPTEKMQAEKAEGSRRNPLLLDE